MSIIYALARHVRMGSLVNANFIDKNRSLQVCKLKFIRTNYLLI